MVKKKAASLNNESSVTLIKPAKKCSVLSVHILTSARSVNPSIARSAKLVDDPRSAHLNKIRGVINPSLPEMIKFRMIL